MKNSAAIGPPWRFVLATKGRQYFAEMKEGRALLRFLPSLYFALSLENKGNLKGPEWLFIFSPPCLQRDWEFSLIRTVTGRIFANHSVSRICPLIVDNVPSSAREGASSLTLINKTNVPPLKITRTLFTIMQWTITDSLLELRKKYRWQNNRVATIKVKSWWNINRMAIVYTLSGSRVFVRGRIHGSMTLTFSPRILTRREKSREIYLHFLYRSFHVFNATVVTNRYKSHRTDNQMGSIFLAQFVLLLLRHQLIKPAACVCQPRIYSFL